MSDKKLANGGYKWQGWSTLRWISGPHLKISAMYQGRYKGYIQFYQHEKRKEQDGKSLGQMMRFKSTSVY